MFLLVRASVIRYVVKAGHADGVDHDTEHDKVIKPLVFGDENCLLPPDILVGKFADQRRD